MTVYYLGGSQGVTGISYTSSSGITESTSSPSTDVILSFPVVATLSRGSAIKILQGMINYLHTDANNPAGPVIPFGSR